MAGVRVVSGWGIVAMVGLGPEYRIGAESRRKEKRVVGCVRVEVAENPTSRVVT